MPEIDYDKMSLEELREAANKELAGLQTKEESARNEKGQFTAKEETAETEEVTTEPEKKTFKRVVDLGDGAGTEVFEADTLEALLDKIVEAKGNATKKIRSQEAELKTLRAKKEQETSQAAADQEFVYSQELLAKPTEAFKKLFKQTTGVDIESFKTTYERSQAMVAVQDKQAAASTFIKDHPDYADTVKNGTLMSKWMGNDLSLDSFNKAYQELKQSGLLDIQNVEANAGQEKQEVQEERIAPTVTKVAPSQQTKKASGLSTQNRTAAPKPAAPSEAEAYALPMDKLRELANSQLAAK